MTAQDEPSSTGDLDLLYGMLAGGALLIVLAWLQAPVPVEQAERVQRIPTPVEQWEALARMEAAEALRPASSVEETLARSATPAVSAPAPTPQAVPTFAFLGKVQEGGATSILLHGAGQTLEVRQPGPIDTEFAVDALDENFLVLRHVRLGSVQKIALAAPAPATADWSPDDSPPD